MLDDREQLTVGQRLRAGRTHVRRFRIEAPTDCGIAAPVIRVTRGAVIGEVLQALSQDLVGRRHWVRSGTDRLGRRQSPHRPGQDFFNPTRLFVRTESATDDRIGEHTAKHGDGENQYRQSPKR